MKRSVRLSARACVALFHASFPLRQSVLPLSPWSQCKPRTRKENRHAYTRVYACPRVHHTCLHIARACIHVCMHTRVYAYTCIHAHVRARTCMHTHVYAHIRARIYTRPIKRVRVHVMLTWSGCVCSARRVALTKTSCTRWR